MKTKILFLISFLLTSILYQLHAQTEVMGAILEDTNWIKDNSPYLVVDDIIIFEDMTLTIEPGVEVLVSQGVTIEIRNGTLIAIGTETDTIKIISNLGDDNRTHWKGFLVKGLVDISTPKVQIDMSYCQLSNADILFDLDYAHHSNHFNHVSFIHNNHVNYQVGQTGFATRFTNCSFINNNRGMHAQNEDGIVDNCYFQDNVIGTSGGVVMNSKFTGHSEHAVFMYGTLINCEIWNNNIGVLSDNHGDTEVSNNYIYDNNVGVIINRFWNDPRVIFAHNRICNNTEWNIEYKYENAADLTLNCWCLDTEDEIKAKIKDAYFDTSLGIISVDTSYDDCNYGLSITSNETPEAENVFSLYPNPSRDKINIDGSALHSNLKYMIYDRFGIVRKTGTLEETNIEISELEFGLYLVKIFDADNTNISVQKFIKN